MTTCFHDPEDRLKLIIRLKKEGLTLQKIGDLVGLTKQRVHQLLQTLGIDTKPKKIRIKKSCLTCGVEMFLPPSQQNRAYCSKPCAGIPKRKYTSTTRKCCYCKQVKPKELFTKDPSRWDGYGGGCKECARLFSRQWLKAFKERDPEGYKKRYQENNRKAALKRKLN